METGFKMTAMLEEVYKEADVRVMEPSSVASTMQTIKVRDTQHGCCL